MELLIDLKFRLSYLSLCYITINLKDYHSLSNPVVFEDFFAIQHKNSLFLNSNLDILYSMCVIIPGYDYEFI